MLKELENLKQLVADNKIGKSPEFGGAGVIISRNPLPCSYRRSSEYLF